MLLCIRGRGFGTETKPAVGGLEWWFRGVRGGHF